MSDIPRPAGPDPARDARVAKRRAEYVAKVSRALDELLAEPEPDRRWGSEFWAGFRAGEAAGDAARDRALGYELRPEQVEALSIYGDDNAYRKSVADHLDCGWNQGGPCTCGMHKIAEGE